MLHPFVVPGHILCLVALGLWLGRQETRNTRIALAAGAISLLAGLALAHVLAPGALLEPILLIATGLLGLAVAASWQTNALVAACLAALSLGAIGLDSLVDSDQARVVLLSAMGTFCAALWVAFILASATTGLNADWQRIGTRVVGSWTAAVALIVLSLRFVQAGG